MGTLKDPAQFVVDLIEDNWNSQNSDARTPTVVKIVDKKRMPQDTLGMESEDLILVYHVSTEIENVSGGSGARNINYNVSVDVRSAWFTPDVPGDVHKVNLQAEVDRIFQNNLLPLTSTGFDILDPDKQIQDFSNRSTGLFRFVYDIALITNADRREN